MFTGGYNLSSYNNRFWITGDGNKALQEWVIRVLWCHTIMHHMPHTELMHACWYSNGSSCFPSRTGRKLIQRSFRFLSRQRPEGQIWYQRCKHSLMIKWWYISHLILLSSAITGVSRCGCSSSLCQSRSYQRIHRRNSPSLDLQWHGSSSHAKNWEVGGTLFDPLTFPWLPLEMHFCHSFQYWPPTFYSNLCISMRTVTYMLTLDHAKPWVNLGLS